MILVTNQKGEIRIIYHRMSKWGETTSYSDIPHQQRTQIEQAMCYFKHLYVIQSTNQIDSVLRQVLVWFKYNKRLKAFR